LNGNQYGVISNFSKTGFSSLNSFMKLGNGSLGEKASQSIILKPDGKE